MAVSQDVEVEGVTGFAPPPAASYRYVISLKNDKLSIWLEDRTSKKQWYKGDMAKSDYISPSNAITDATPADYLQCFRDALDCELDEAKDALRELQSVKGGALRLGLAVPIRVLRATRVATYSFDLEPVSVERIDVLESKLRDQQDVLERLRGEDGGQEVSFIELVASAKDASRSNLLWQGVGSSNFAVDENLGEVKIGHPGVYTIAAVLNAAAYSRNQLANLMKNGDVLQTGHCGYQGDYASTLTLSVITRLDAGDVLTVKCNCNIASASHLTIARLGC